MDGVVIVCVCVYLWYKCRGMHVWVQGYACTNTRVLLGVWCVCVWCCMHMVLMMGAYVADGAYMCS